MLCSAVPCGTVCCLQDIVDINPELPQFLAVVDGTQLSHVLAVRRPHLHRAWTEAMAGCWRRSTGPKLDLSEAAMAAPLTEFIAGCGCRLNFGQYQVRNVIDTLFCCCLYRLGQNILCNFQGFVAMSSSSSGSYDV